MRDLILIMSVLFRDSNNRKHSQQRVVIEVIARSIKRLRMIMLLSLKIFTSRADEIDDKVR